MDPVSTETNAVPNGKGHEVGGDSTGTLTANKSQTESIAR